MDVWIMYVYDVYDANKHLYGVNGGRVKYSKVKLSLDIKPISYHIKPT